jgi:hypothetical protein
MSKQKLKPGKFYTLSRSIVPWINYEFQWLDRIPAYEPWLFLGYKDGNVEALTLVGSVCILYDDIEEMCEEYKLC